MTNIGVSYAALSAGAEGLTHEERQLLAKLDDLRAGLTRVAAGWTGEAKAAFDVNIAVLAEETLRLGTLLGRTGNQVAEAGAAYRATDLRLRGAIEGG
ncbi:WXG100 family type VII secretion target [Streptomyces sp. MS19]|uniref:WXG100 family type VII secretion target n=1 Tax=Streptomyces sp. MS19 TaxID=3385972 RepID=UPI0039A10CA2